MSATLRHDVDFNGLFKKLGHHLEEIRVRALENILSKLDHKLICDSDLVQERHLFIRLLEWFNFPKPCRQADVLGLLLRLSQNTTAAEVLQDIGGIQFLTNIRKDVSSSLQPMVDEILENTMRLPDSQLTDHAPECIYQKHSNTGMESALESTVARSTHDHTGALSTLAPSDTSRIPGYREPSQGEPVTLHTQIQEPAQQAEIITDSSSCLRMTIFPWLALTPTDRHVIVSTNTSLQSRDASLLVSTCEFLSDVVFQDFPAEVFLQRPNIIKNLLSLLTVTSQDLGVSRLHAIRSLADFTACLHSKIRCHQDPNLYTAKQDFSTTPSPFSTPSSSTSANNNNNHRDGRPSVVGWTDTRHRGDGRDGDTTASSTGSSRTSSLGLSPGPEHELIDFDDMPSLQYIQMTIPQFCCAVMDKSLPLLKTNDQITINEVFNLLYQTLDIVVAVVTASLWDDETMAARDCIDKFVESLDVIADMLKYHHHSNLPFDLEESTIEGPGDLEQHRLTYIGLCVFVNKFLKALVPVDKETYRLLPEYLVPKHRITLSEYAEPQARSGDSCIFTRGDKLLWNKCVGVISEALLSVINMLVYDECVRCNHRDIHVCLLGYLQHMDTARYDIYVATATVCTSMQKTCKFMALCQEEVSRLTKETVQYCESGFLSLAYHEHLNYITETVKVASDICSKSQHYESQQGQYRKLILQFLAHPVSKLRLHTYTTILQTVQCSLSVAKASDPSSMSECDKVKFIINSDILYEIVVFGLADKNAKVSSTASELTVHLLKSQLLMSPELWISLLQNIMRSLPILQSYAGVTSVLGTTILSMLETKTSVSASEPSTHEKFRGTLRCMLSSDIKVRSEALKRLSWYLSHEDNSSHKLPIFSQLDVTHLSNILIVHTPRSVDEDLGCSVFQVDGLRKVYEIFTSLTVDPGVKKSAVDQLAIILQDQTLHSAFRKDGGFEKVLEHIQLAIQKDGESNTNTYLQYVPGCVTVLRSLVHHDYSLRHRLATDASIYYTLLRVCLLHARDDRTCYEVSHLFTLLLFDEQARFFLGSSKNTTFSVPHIVKVRYHLPFRVCTHYDVSPHQCSPPPSPDPLLTGLPLEMLRVSWNTAWNGDMDGLVKRLKVNQTKQTDGGFSPKLKLTPTDRVLLTTTHIKHSVQSSVYDISNATSHFDVSRSLTRLLTLLLTKSDTEAVPVFHTLDWCNALARFVKTVPASTADESLLLDVLRFINMVLKLTNQCPDNVLQWLGEVLYQAKGALIGLLHSQPGRDVPGDVSEPNVKRSLDKNLLAFIVTYNSSLTYTLTAKLKFHQLRGDLVYRLLQRLNVTDAPHFYNLASLEGTLQCLMHLTARPGWSTECTEEESSSLCSQVLSSLLEVVFAFHIGRGATSMSYMGRGVTKAATLCLRHIIYEMATLSKDQMWTKHWLYSGHGNDPSVEPGLDWMLTLWAYRDAEVRAAGLGIAVSLSCTEEGCLLLTTNCRHIPGGIWAAAFSILLDHAECSMVRQQAALLLVNLTSQPLPSGSTESDHKTWQGPVVMDTEYQVSLVGLTALLALLYHSQFYREMMMVLSNYYPQPTIQPNITSDLYQLSASSSENTLSVLADAGLVPRVGGSHHNTMSLLQSSAVSSVHAGDRPGGVGTNGRPVLHHTPPSSRTTPVTVDQHGNVETPTGDQPADNTDYVSVTTPCLVSAVSQLVRNLMIQAPQDTVTSLTNESLIPFFVSMIDPSFLEGIRVLSSTDQLELFFTELVEMHISILHLLQTCLVHDTSTRMNVLEDKVSLGNIISLLSIFSDVSADSECICYDLWEAVLSFLTTLVQIQCAPAVQVLAQVLHKQWNPITDSLQKILDGSHGNKLLYTQCLHFLSVLCSEEGKMAGKHYKVVEEISITSLLNTQLTSDTEDKDASKLTAGSSFCKSLITTYDQCSVRRSESTETGERTHVMTTLRCLLAISHTAKTTALEMGLVESLIDSIKQTHGKLNMAVLQAGKGGNKGRDDPIIQQLEASIDLLRNFMFNNEDVKMSCYHSGLQNLVHKLWSWCQLDITLMQCVLSLLSTFTALCPTAASSLAYTSSSSTTLVAQTKCGLSTNSLVHCIIKHVDKDKHKDSTLKSVFGLLSNLSLSAECRNIIWKSNFLQKFADLNPKKSKSSKTKGKQLLMEVLWLELLVNLSFSLEGQQMILKIPDCVCLLLEFIDCGHVKQRDSAITVIRNICCHSSNKPKIMANDQLLPALLECIESDEDKTRAVGASALWALVYNNQKAKVLMKNGNIVSKLQDSLNNMSITDNRLVEKWTLDIQAVIQTISE